jgi:hypothetical protein
MEIMGGMVIGVLGWHGLIVIDTIAVAIIIFIVKVKACDVSRCLVFIGLEFGHIQIKFDFRFKFEPTN